MSRISRDKTFLSKFCDNLSRNCSGGIIDWSASNICIGAISTKCLLGPVNHLQGIINLGLWIMLIAYKV